MITITMVNYILKNQAKESCALDRVSSTIGCFEFFELLNIVRRQLIYRFIEDLLHLDVVRIDIDDCKQPLDDASDHLLLIRCGMFASELRVHRFGYIKH
jgi:hypothetical protein